MTTFAQPIATIMAGIPTTCIILSKVAKSKRTSVNPRRLHPVLHHNDINPNVAVHACNGIGSDSSGEAPAVANTTCGFFGDNPVVFDCALFIKVCHGCSPSMESLSRYLSCLVEDAGGCGAAAVLSIAGSRSSRSSENAAEWRVLAAERRHSSSIVQTKAISLCCQRWLYRQGEQRQKWGMRISNRQYNESKPFYIV